MANWLDSLHIIMHDLIIYSTMFNHIQLQAKHDFIEQELSRSKQKENLMEVELKGLREEVSTGIKSRVLLDFLTN